MQLDRTTIAIRPRGFLETCDLALRVVRAYAPGLAAALALAALPLGVLNYFLLAAGGAEFEVPVAYYMLLLMLMVWELPLGTAFVTLYLGQILFGDRPSAGQLVRRFVTRLPQMLWYQVGWRAVFVPLVVTWMVPFVVAPYLAEVILLEQTPWRGRGGLSTRQRSRLLHSRIHADLFVRWLGAMWVAMCLTASLVLALWALRGKLFEVWEPSPAFLTIVVPAAVWVVAAFFAVVRFLSYVDLRIRREGWDVELVLRAEAERMAPRREGFVAEGHPR